MSRVAKDRHTLITGQKLVVTPSGKGAGKETLMPASLELADWFTGMSFRPLSSLLVPLYGFPRWAVLEARGGEEVRTPSSDWRLLVPTHLWAESEGG